jgi:hypothetical protein
MRTNLILSCAAAAALYIGSVTNGMTAGGTFTRGCAARDIQVLMMLETSAIPAEELNDAMRTIMRARMMCFDGLVVDALALYDGIAQSISSEWVLSSQRP